MPPPLAGVTVKVKNTDHGTITGTNGTYKINISDNNNTLIFSYLGYETKEVNIGNRSVVNVSLTPNNKQLSQLVVIGYGTAKKSDLTGSVSSVSAKELTTTPATSLDEALQGRAAGVQVTRLSGKPGAATSIRIRETSSINVGNEPLYVIDGMIVDRAILKI